MPQSEAVWTRWFPDTIKGSEPKSRRFVAEGHKISDIGQDSNPRPLGPEPNTLPLRHDTIKGSKPKSRRFVAEGRSGGISAGQEYRQNSKTGRLIIAELSPLMLVCGHL
ncbi:hypothetical protein Bbelb_108790 [Branchiostoma belcheri]|nr:hypothetical protein Bbelb_108790 [Branchiostoma belcheri]